jgi:hypothetical protein
MPSISSASLSKVVCCRARRREQAPKPRGPERRCPGPSSCPYSPECVERRILRNSQAPLLGGDVFPEHLLVADADRGVAMDEFPLTVLLKEDHGITEGYLCAIG